VWIAAGGADYAGKPRPVVIIQDNSFQDLNSVTIALITSDPADLPELRIDLLPNQENGLREPCRVMIDKIATIPKSKLGQRIGVLHGSDMVRVNQAILVFLGLASAMRPQEAADEGN
jgi:mRNA interferase MazF